MAYRSTGQVLSSNLLWRRKCQVQVYEKSASGQKILDVSNAASVAGLRVSFEITRNALYAANTALIKIYNLNTDTENAIIEEGYRVTVFAGYDPNNDGMGLYGQIFDGTVVMCNRWKENGTDFVLQILAMDGSQFIYSSFASLTFEKNSTGRQIIENTVNAANANLAAPVKVEYISPGIADMTVSKGGAVYGLPKNTLSDFAKSKNGTWYIDKGKLYVVAYSDTTFLPEGLQAVVLTPQTGLIGLPEQIDQGVSAKSLLNPKMIPYGLISVPSYLIKRQLPNVNSQSGHIDTIYNIDPDGIYRIISVKFTGDTRGGESGAWFTDVTTVWQGGALPATLTQN